MSTSKPDKTSKLNEVKPSPEKSSEKKKAAVLLKDALEKCKLSFIKLKTYQKVAAGVGALTIVGAVGIGIAYGVNPSATSSAVSEISKSVTKVDQPLFRKDASQDTISSDSNKSDSDKDENKDQTGKEETKDSNTGEDSSGDSKKSEDKKTASSNDSSSSSKSSNTETSKSSSGSSGTSSNSGSSNSSSDGGSQESKPAKEKKPIYRTETIYETQPVYEKQWVPNIVEVFDYRQERYIVNGTGAVFYSKSSLDAYYNSLSDEEFEAAGGYVDDSYDVYKKVDQGHYENVQVGTKQVAVGTRQVIDHWE